MVVVNADIVAVDRGCVEVLMMQQIEDNYYMAVFQNAMWVLSWDSDEESQPNCPRVVSVAWMAQQSWFDRRCFETRVMHCA